MSFNYRVVAREGELVFMEIYYDEEGQINGYADTLVSPCGETFLELSSDVSNLMLALRQPILNYADLAAMPLIGF